MQITKVKFYDVSNSDESSFLSKCSVVLDDCLILNGIKILRGKKGKYVIMPSKDSGTHCNCIKKNQYSEDVFHPVDSHFFFYMSDTILKGYDRLKKDGVCVYYPE